MFRYLCNRHLRCVAFEVLRHSQRNCVFNKRIRNIHKKRLRRWHGQEKSATMITTAISTLWFHLCHRPYLLSLPQHRHVQRDDDTGLIQGPIMWRLLSPLVLDPFKPWPAAAIVTTPRMIEYGVSPSVILKSKPWIWTMTVSGVIQLATFAIQEDYREPEPEPRVCEKGL